jgi:hypothetical protein
MTDLLHDVAHTLKQQTSAGVVLNVPMDPGVFEYLHMSLKPRADLFRVEWWTPIAVWLFPADKFIGCTMSDIQWAAPLGYCRWMIIERDVVSGAVRVPRGWQLPSDWKLTQVVDLSVPKPVLEAYHPVINAVF